MTRKARENSKTGIYTEFILKLFATEKQSVKKEFEKFMNEYNEDICLDYEERHKIADYDILKLIEEKYRIRKGYFHLLARQEMNII